MKAVVFFFILAFKTIYTCIHKHTHLCRPYVDVFVETSARQKFAVRTESYTVHRLGVLRQSVDASATVNVPEPHGRVEGRTDQSQVHVRILRARPGGRPLYRVNFFTVRLEIVQAGILLH